MSLWSRITGKKRSEKIRSYHDIAATTRHNERHWSFADGSDADAAISADLPTTRNRAREEIRNNSYLKGIVDTFANDVVGPGPTLQYIPAVDAKFAAWMRESDLSGRLSFADSLKLNIIQLLESGEALISLAGNNRYLNMNYSTHIDGVQELMPDLKLLQIEPDRLSTPWGFVGDPNMREGVEVDGYGKPLRYHILRKHPGDARNYEQDQYNVVSAENIIHLYRQDRPGQSRGFPWIAPALPLASQLRRYTLAVIAAAETAADLSAVVESTSDGLEPEPVASLDVIDIERRSMVTLPAGWKMSQFRPEQPTTSYADFKREIINEACRCLNMPLNVGLGNSSGYNYASGRLDWQVYYQTIAVIRAWIGRIVCDRVFSEWLREAVMIPRFFDAKTTALIHNNTEKVEWLWTGRKHVDPQKEASASDIRLGDGATTLVDEWVAEGKDPDNQKTKLLAEIAWCNENGLVHPFMRLAPKPVEEEPKTEPDVTEKDTNNEDE